MQCGGGLYFDLVTNNCNWASATNCDGRPTEDPSSSSCPYTKDNVSWGEYQVTIPMPSGAPASSTVVMVFDADTTIVSVKYL